ncbi:hypothetical protein PE067_01040 [Paracoccus sp. DMF-8]|uniref:hypothetical protein n=1 Tax=Paracoccus sp. DMF-8 TaxID=3019445 RepID=UPI0023E82756|nr:hypothetical protein [Paracoccus sp. DMF-8]MDF3604864.1 hypothetical protein [Paracoccus sp. DMF-8]
MANLHIVRLEGDSETDPISLQLWLDKAGQPLARGTTFGVVGGLAPGSEPIIPFVLFKDGTIDCGSGYEETDGRYGKANFYEQNRIMERGALFTIDWQEDGAHTYRVLSVTSLSS